MNLLCRSQAYFPFDGVPFYEYVRSGKIEGAIEIIDPERYLWTVPERFIPATTEKCDKAGFIFNKLEDVPNIEPNDIDVIEYHKGDAQREANGKKIRDFVDAWRKYDSNCNEKNEDKTNREEQ